MSNKKIVHILYSGLGGHGSVVFSLLNESKDDNFDHFVLFYGIENLVDDYKRKCENYKIPFVFIKKRRGLGILSGFKVFKALRKIKADYVLINSTNLILPGAFYKLLNDKKIVIIEHTPNHMKGLVDWVKSLFAQLLADAIISLSTKYRDQLISKFKRLFNSKKNHIVPNGIDIAYYKPLNVNKNSDFIKIGSHCRLTPQKDFYTLFSAIALLAKNERNSFNFYVAGSGEDQANLEKFAHSLGISKYVNFLGMLSEKGVVEFLQGLDIYVMSSFAETMCTAVMQAMSCSLPVIATNISGINNIVTHKETGLLFKVKNQEELAEQLNYLILNKDFSQKLGSQARIYAIENLSQTHMYNGYMKVINSL